VTRSVCAVAAACTSRRSAWGLEPIPRQALGFLARETAVHDHDRNPLSPGFSEVLRHSEHLASNGCRCWPGPAAQASLTSLCPPYADGSSTATRFPRSAAWRASACH
jgi:hypothetical protein